MSEANELYEIVSKTYNGLECSDSDFEYTVAVVDLDLERIVDQPGMSVSKLVRSCEKIRELQELFADCSDSGVLIGATLGVTIGGVKSSDGISTRRVLHFEVSVQCGGKFCNESIDGRALKIATRDEVLSSDSCDAFPILEFLGDAGLEDSDPGDFYTSGDN